MKKFFLSLVNGLFGISPAEPELSNEQLVNADPVSSLEPTPAPTMDNAQWTHNSDLYRLMIPGEAFDPSTGEQGFMATVITNQTTQESRLIPYLNIDVIGTAITKVNGTTGETTIERLWEIVAAEA